MLYLSRLSILVFVALTQHLIQSTMRCEHSTILCIKWPLTLILNRFQSTKSFGKLRLRAFQLYHQYYQYYICRYCQYRIRISNAFNAIYDDTVDTKHAHMFLPITFLIFNQFSIHKQFWKAETEGFSTIPSILYMSILSIQDKDL